MKLLPIPLALLTITYSMSTYAASFAATNNVTLSCTELRPDIRKTREQCENAKPSTMGISSCIITAMDSWEEELNKQYQLLLQKQPLMVKHQLQLAQQAWVRYKDVYFKAINSFYQQQEGTVWNIIDAEAKLSVIKEKAIDLAKLQQSTDLAAPANSVPCNTITDD